MAEIVLEGVTKTYPDGTTAVDGLDLALADQELVVLVGPSGCGKTTALRMIAGLEEITAGTIRIGDRIVNDVAPKDRDIAMVFQNYALYPHMDVFENMAFGLKLQKVPKAEVERRVAEAARTLGITELLRRKPKALSGGQRQRVAMGRAIVRQPRAFLMDEPLSNLDAKLRVQMRAEIARIQHEVGVTTVYVTHDQTEAMTMGDRVAVLRKGVLQQVAPPQELYDRPVNLFVAGFIGSPAMNLFDVTIVADGQDDLAVTFGGNRLPIPRETVARCPALRRFVDRVLVVGIRPEGLEDAEFVAGARPEHVISTVVDLREALGSEVVVHCTIDAPPALTEDAKELAADIGQEAVERVREQAVGGRTTILARCHPRTKARAGSPIDLVVDTSCLYFFDPADGSGLHAPSDEQP